jgi:acetyltransferase-like isoleucine patch superfamily enzyme
MRFVYKRTAMLHSPWFVYYLRKQGCRIGQRTCFYGRKNIDLQRPFLIEIGDDVTITDDVTILTHGHDWSVLRNKYKKCNIIGSAGKVKIGNNVFIGTKAIILKGVTIGDNVVIGAGSVVTKDIPSDSVALGVPCRVVMSLDDHLEKRRRKCLEEAMEYVREICRVGKEPKEEDFKEFFQFFIKRDLSCRVKGLDIRNQLGPASDDFMATEPVFKTFQEFIRTALKDFHDQ